MTVIGGWALRSPAEARAYVYGSIDTNGRPYRSPQHLARARAGETVDNVTTASFSRDHVVSLLNYTIFTKDITPLSRVWSYAKSHDLKVCPGSYSQCGLTPNVLDAIGDMYEFIGQSRPALTYIPDAVTSLVQSATSEKLGSWQLTLVSEQILLKVLTGHNSDAWADVAQKVWKRAPDNIYYKFVYLAAEGAEQDDADMLSRDLLKVMRGFKAPGKSWVWNSLRVEDAVGYDLVYLADLIKRGI
jgi:hypothetical protein